MPLGIVLLVVWLFLLLRYPRVMLPASGVIVALALLLAAFVGIRQWQNDQHLEQLHISIAYQPEGCTQRWQASSAISLIPALPKVATGWMNHWRRATAGCTALPSPRCAVATVPPSCTTMRRTRAPHFAIDL